MEGHDSAGMVELSVVSFTASKLCGAVLFSRVRLGTSALSVPNDGNPSE